MTARQRRIITGMQTATLARLCVIERPTFDRCIYCSVRLPMGVLDYCSASCSALAIRDNEEER
jgi:hypothetical protein